MIAAEAARAVWFARARTVEVREERLPGVGPHQLRVRAVASGISHGTEMLVYRGEVDTALPLDLPTLAGRFGFPVKYGYASVGRVVEAGAEVSAPRPGELVFVHHPHQSEYVVDADLAIALPAELDPAVGVLTANVETAVNVCLDAHPHLGDTAVVIGQGVVGLLVGVLLRRAGVTTLIAVDPVSDRRQLARQLGADAVLEPGRSLATDVAGLTGGRGADLVVEASGAPAALQPAIDVAGREATVVVCSWYGTKGVPLDLGGTFHRGRLRIISSQVGGIASDLSARWDMGRRRELATRLLTELPLAPLVTHRMAFEDAAAAYRLLEDAAQAPVQVVLEYGDV